ncbi:4-hydroxy-tetrahydrodipicolinate synthase [bacterium]|nr:4-hydroxy-tetrahydrodipicolinate synthase [bacterium]MBT7088145.1 4-hydroxy-tetrahydrodipicolinate synthase [bacterium]
MKKNFGKLMTAMITPFKENGDINYPEVARIAQHLVNNGTDTILISGTTGESPNLSDLEKEKLFEIVSDTIKHKSPKSNTSTYIMLGTGTNNTRHAINATQKAEKWGADISLQVVPYYNKPPQEGLYQHFKTIAENTNLPIILYNVPGRTSKNLEPETVARLAQIKNIVGLKEASGNLEQIKQTIKLMPADFMIYSGNDDQNLEIMKLGGTGAISVASHCAGAQIKKMLETYQNGDLETATKIDQQLKELYRILFITSSPIPVKAAMQMMGFDTQKLRLPLIKATNSEKEQIKTVLKQLNII